MNGLPLKELRAREETRNEARLIGGSMEDDETQVEKHEALRGNV